MKRIILFCCLVGIVGGVHAQMNTSLTTVNLPLSLGGTTHAAVWFPQEYSGTTKLYPLLIFCHGSGEAGTNFTQIYNSTTAGGPPYLIMHSGWPNSFTNQITGQQEQFIVCMPQRNNGWSSSGDDIEQYLIYLIETLGYRIDINRIIITGLSSGGGGTSEFIAHLNGDENNGNTSTRKYKAAFVIPMSSATNQPIQAWGTAAASDQTASHYFGDQNNDTYGSFSQMFFNFINNASSGLSVFTGNPPYTQGHGSWFLYYAPTYKESHTYHVNGQTVSFTNANIYEEALGFNRSGIVVPTHPTASAGNDQTVQLPTSTCTLVGGGTPGNGHTIASYTWKLITNPSGVIPVITNPNASTTTVTNFGTIGAYTFQLKVKNEVNDSAISTCTVTVTASNIVVRINPPSQTVHISIGQTTTQAIVDGSGTTGSAINDYTWLQLSGPNTATILTQTNPSTTFANLIAGTYTVQLGINREVPLPAQGGFGGTGTATITVVDDNPTQGCPSTHVTHTIHPDPADSGLFVGKSSSNLMFSPGDTIKFVPGEKWTYLEIDSLQAFPGCEVVIQNAAGGQVVLLTEIKLEDCQSVRILGNGEPTQQYGILIQPSVNLFVQGKPGIEMRGKVKNMEVANVATNHTDIGVLCEGVGLCDPSQNFPNWKVDSINIHDCRIIGTWNEGMYLGNTSPDNDSITDPRPVECPEGSGHFIYPFPAKNGHMKVWNNFVDSTGRGGIQMANSFYGVSEIYNNTIRHSGINGDDAQGSGIVLGKYTNAYVHDNNIRNTFTWGISSIGAGSTNVPVNVQNNTIDSSGYTRSNGLAVGAGSLVNYDPSTIQWTPNALPWPQAIEIDTRPSHYIGSGGTATPGQDSTLFYIERNTIGLYKGTVAINVDDDYNLNQKNGNIICSNFLFNTNDAPVHVASGINFSTICTNSNPLVSIDGNNNLILPTNRTTLTSSVTLQSGATVSSYVWTQISGTTLATIVTPNTANTQIMNLVQGTYKFQLTVTDSNGLQGFSQITVTVQGSIINITTKKVRVNRKTNTKSKKGQ